jgi:hypothetical protein
MARENEIDTGTNGDDEVRQDRLWFLDGMDRFNCALQGTDDFEQMGDVLNAVLSIFRCDRAWIVSPCDPESRTLTFFSSSSRLNGFGNAVDVRTSDQQIGPHLVHAINSLAKIAHCCRGFNLSLCNRWTS